MYMKVHEFRKDLKKCFDEAIVEPIYIERGGIIFQLAKYGTVSEGLRKSVMSDWRGPDNGSFTATIEPIDYYCKNGHLSDENGKCLQKDCKYKGH